MTTTTNIDWNLTYAKSAIALNDYRLSLLNTGIKPTSDDEFFAVANKNNNLVKNTWILLGMGGFKNLSQAVRYIKSKK